MHEYHFFYSHTKWKFFFALHGTTLFCLGSAIKLNTIIIIYLDCLPPPRRGSRVKSDNTHTIIKYTPISPYTTLEP